MTERRVEYMPLDSIERAPRNPKGHAASDIEGAIDRFGLGELPLLDERTGRLVAGHGRLDDFLARRDAGRGVPDGGRLDDDGGWLMPVVRGWASSTDADAEAYLITSNNLTTKGGWDRDGLAAILGDLAETDLALLTVTGFTEDDLARLLGTGSDDADQEPLDFNSWPSLHIRVPPHVAAAWLAYVDTHHGEQVNALAALLEVDPEDPTAPPPPRRRR